VTGFETFSQWVSFIGRDGALRRPDEPAARPYHKLTYCLAAAEIAFAGRGVMLAP
jgi:hypothetical protein